MDFVETEIEREVRLASEARDESLASHPERRRARGVVHTPARLARFVARRADELLREELGIKRGLADPRVSIVDPACGTGAFLAATLSIVEGRRSAPAALVGFDVDEDAVAICHGALAPVAERLGAELRLEAKNTLASLDVPAPTEIVCVLGNPPWAGKSANADAALTGTLLDDFRRETGGERLREKKIGVLSDDYVRFVRWSAELARRSGRGAVIGLVTNASFLDGPVHRGMRAALSRWFSRLEVFDLGGSALLSRGEGRDENVFGVRPAVACTFGVRPPGHGELLEAARVHYARLEGSREEKLEAISEATPPPTPITPRQPLIAFGPPSDEPSFPEAWLSLDAIFPFHQEGVQTNRDEALVAESERVLLERLRRFAEGEPDPALRRVLTPSSHYDPARARAIVREAMERGEPLCRPLAYRPGEERAFCHLRGVCHRPRPSLLEAMGRSDWALLSVRKDRGRAPWNHFAVSRSVPDNCFFSPRSSCRTRAFPTHDPGGEENLSAEAKGRFADATGRAPDAAEVSLYALAVLSSEAYRATFERSLREDYPRIPVPSGRATFERGVALGRAIKDRWLGPWEPGEWRVGHHKATRKPAGIDGALAECDAFFRAEWGGGVPSDLARVER